MATTPGLKAPRAPRAKTAPTLPEKTRRRGRPPKAKTDLSALSAAMEARDTEGLFWALAKAIVSHTEFCHPGTRDHIAGLGSLTALLKHKVAKPEVSETDQDLEKVAKAVQGWMPIPDAGSPSGPKPAHA